MGRRADEIEADIRHARRRIEGTSRAMTEKLEMLEQRLRETAADVKRRFDVRYHTARRPWAMLGGSILTGYALGSLSRRSSRSREIANRPAPQTRSTTGLEPYVKRELASVKALAVAAVVRTIWEMVRQAFFAGSAGERRAHGGRNGGPGEERGFEGR